MIKLTKWVLVVTLIFHAMPILSDTINSLALAEKCVVKLYGEGGVQGIEGYQSGLLIAKDRRLTSEGWILTVDSPTLGGGELVAVLANGARYSAHVQSVDPRYDLVLLKIDLDNTELTAFPLKQQLTATARAGTTAFALSNTFNIATGDEPITWQRTTIAIESEVDFRRLNRQPRPVNVLILDAVTSNPGSAGGALVDRQGNLLGMIGKESRSGAMGSWLNYAIPTSTLRASMELMTNNEEVPQQEPIEASMARKPGALLAKYGFALIPSIGSSTPPFVEYVRTGSLANRAGIFADDLIISIQGNPVGTTTLVEQFLLRYSQSDEPIRVALLRDDELVVVWLKGE